LKENRLLFDGLKQCAAWPKHHETKIRPKTFFWVHYPKTGTSLVNVIVRTMCKDVPKYASLATKIDPSQSAHLGQYFEDCYPKAMAACDYHSPEYKGKHLGVHVSIKYFQPTKNVYITMLRNPDARVASGFNHNLHDCHNCATGTTLGAYGKNVQGMYARLLLGFGFNEKRSLADFDLKLALTRLSQFGFVGLTEEWNLSICLFHQKFGGEPFGPEFLKNRAGVTTSHRDVHSAQYLTARPGQYGTSTLASIIASEKNRTGRVDWIDEAIYRKGVIMFWNDVEKHGGRSMVPKDVTISNLQSSFDNFVGSLMPVIFNVRNDSVGPISTDEMQLFR
jgi:hypothetical protein